MPHGLDGIRSVIDRIPPYLYAPIVFLVWITVLWTLKKLVVARLRKWSRTTSVIWDDLLIDSLAVPLNFLIFASGLTVLAYVLPMPEKADRLAQIALQGSIVFAIVLFFDNLVRNYMKRKAGTAAFGNISHGLTKGLLRGFIIGLGILIFLDLLGISITPILASLGIGSLAVALALQDTLSNFFAGLYISIDKPVEIGHFVKLESGEEGYVSDIGWRSTRIRLLSNNTVVMPNKKLVESVLTNYYLPAKQMGMVVNLGVHYSSDLEKVERVTNEVIGHVMKTVPGGVPETTPMTRFHTFGDNSLQFSAVMQCKEFTDNYLVKHEFMKALTERYRKEGIIMPYPMRTLSIDGDSAKELQAVLAGSSK